MRNRIMLCATLTGLLLLTGCSLKNPFGIGYDHSVSETNQSNSFGVTGSPKNIYKCKDIIRKTQYDYVNSELPDVLYFAVDKDCNMLVKKDRDADFEPYELSPWKLKIEQGLKEKELREMQIREARIAQERSANFSPIGSDINVNKANDLSIAYKSQGKMVTERTKIGDIIRDNGKIQQVFVANYVNSQGNLVSSHDLYVVVKRPSWIIGEKTPRNVGKIPALPTPISKALLSEQPRVSKAQNRIIHSYLEGNPPALVNAINTEPTKQEIRDNNIIKNFLNK